MDRNQIREWAREADIDWHSMFAGDDEENRLARFAALVAAHEREQCALAANEFLTKGRSPHGARVAAAIRARGEVTRPS